jgi:hypothetical protein
MRFGTVGLPTQREAIHDDGHVKHAVGHDVGHGACLVSSHRSSGAGDSRVHKVPPVVIERPTSDPAWLLGLRIYLGVAFVGNLAWEILHLPLYTIWTTGGLREQAFAAGHCALGDLLIAASTLVLALLLAGDRRWPRVRFWPIAILAIGFGLAYAIFSEWLNIVVRSSWSYSEWMPIVPLAGLKVGLSPLLQWVVVPGVAFAITRRVTANPIDGD